MSAAAERIAPREGLKDRLAERLANDLANPPEVIALVLDALEGEGFSIVPDEWVPDAGLFDDAAERLDAVRALLTDRQERESDTASRVMRELSDAACTVLGLPARSERS